MAHVRVTLDHVDPEQCYIQMTTKESAQLARRAYSWLFQLAQMWKLLAPGVGLGDLLTPVHEYVTNCLAYYHNLHFTGYPNIQVDQTLVIQEVWITNQILKSCTAGLPDIFPVRNVQHLGIMFLTWLELQ
jgi:hypothetical protein